MILIGNKVNLKAQDPNGLTAFHLAARYGRKECLEVLYARDATLQEITDNKKNTALHLATGCNKPVCVKLLVALNAPTRALDAAGNTALHIAAAQGFTECVQALIDHDPTLIDERDSNFGYTSLYWAVRKNKIDCVRILLEKNPTVDARDTSLTTPLLVAASSGYTEVVKLLLENHASTDARDSQGRSALDLATKYNHTSCIALLKAREPQPVVVIDPNNLTSSIMPAPSPLIFCKPFKKRVFSSDASSVHLEPKATQDHARDSQKNESPKRSREELELSEAPLGGFQNGKRPSLEKLEESAEKKLRSHDQDFWASLAADFEMDIDPETSDAKPLARHTQDLWEVFTADFEKDPLALIDLESITASPVDKNIESSPTEDLKKALDSRNFDAAKALIVLDPKLVNTRDSLKQTPLHRAVCAGDTAFLAFLCTMKPNLNARDYRRMTPLLCAASLGHIDCVRILIAEGASITISDGDDESTALHWASAGDEPALLKLLLDTDPSLIASKNNRGRTAAHSAAGNGKNKCLEMLIRYHAKLTETDILGRTPLHYAAMNDMVGCLDRILTHNPGLIDTPDHEGNTALHLATQMGRTKSVEFLLISGANKDLENNTLQSTF